MLLTLFLLACTDPTSAPGGSDDGDTGADATDAEPEWHCPSDFPDVSPGEETDWRVTSTHYTLEVDGTEARALELGLMAEGAWLALDAWFGVAPPSPPLLAGFYASADAMAAAMDRDGVSPVAAAGYYSPGSLRAYTSDQPTHYYDQVLFLHELTHQWHQQAAGADGHQAQWYAEGLAEALSRHDWDGACLRIGRVPVLSQEDFAARAQDIVDDAGGADLDAWISADSWPGARPIWYAVVSWLIEEHPDEFLSLREAYDGDSGLDPSTVLGSLDSVAFEDWLASEQEPMQIIWTEWVHRSSDHVWGLSSVSSAALLKQPVDRFDATLVVPGGDFWAGVVVGWDSAQENTMLFVDQSGALILSETTAGEMVFWDGGTVPPPDDALPMTLTWDGDQPVLDLGGEEVRPATTHAKAAGLAVYGASVEFTNLAW